MTPVQKVQARAEAYDLLGVSRTAGDEEIRAAWRRIAFGAHPDNTNGDEASFMRAKAAYDLLRGDASGTASSGRPFAAGRPGRARPRVSTRIITLDPAIIAACRDLLADPASAETAAATLRLHPDAPLDAAGPAAEHVPEAIQQHGRALTYLVSSALAAGANRIALPTTLLQDPRRATPRILAIGSTMRSVGEVKVPEGVRRRLFPGTREVRLRFGETGAASADP